MEKFSSQDRERALPTKAWDNVLPRGESKGPKVTVIVFNGVAFERTKLKDADRLAIQQAVRLPS